ncbi:MAG: hypothetical protein QXL74_07690, partial [Candidatus Bathyarchaeia archaeon]
MGSNPIPGSNTPSFGALHIASPFKSSGTESSVTADIHDYTGRLRRARERLGQLPYSGVLLSFLDHLESLDFSK